MAMAARKSALRGADSVQRSASEIKVKNAVGKVLGADRKSCGKQITCDRNENCPFFTSQRAASRGLQKCSRCNRRLAITRKDTVIRFTFRAENKRATILPTSLLLNVRVLSFRIKNILSFFRYNWFLFAVASARFYCRYQLSRLFAIFYSKLGNKLRHNGFVRHAGTSYQKQIMKLAVLNMHSVVLVHSAFRGIRDLSKNRLGLLSISAFQFIWKWMALISASLALHKTAF